MIKDGELFLCARTDGDIVPAQVSGEGFYAYDTRYALKVQLDPQLELGEEWIRP